MKIHSIMTINPSVAAEPPSRVDTGGRMPGVFELKVEIA